MTAVRNRLTGLAVQPRRVLHGPAAPDWLARLTRTVHDMHMSHVHVHVHVHVPHVHVLQRSAKKTLTNSKYVSL